MVQNLQLASQVFAQQVRAFQGATPMVQELQRLEQRGDDLLVDLVTLLNSTYVTPIDREDFLQLANRLDDVIDGLEACAVRFDLFHVDATTPEMALFADNIADSIAEISSGLGRLQDRRFADVHSHTQHLHQLERVGDMLLRDSLRGLFKDPVDPLFVIKLKEIYELLERVSDMCAYVGDTLDAITFKHM